jgi:pilus assembly protein CpaB
MRLVFVGLMLVTALALGLIAYQVARPPPTATTATKAPGPPPTLSYLVAAHPLPPGTLERDSDLTVKTVPREQLPAGAIVDSPEGRAQLTGALVQHYVETGTPIRLEDVLRPRDRGFLAAVLAPGTRAVSIAVDPVSGVGGLIWPGDRVDVILTQEIPTAGTSAKRVVGETVLSDVRVVAVDQDIVQGASPTAGISGRLASTVTVQATEDQAERLTVAGRLGRLSLAIRAVGSSPSRGGGAMPMVTGEDVSPALMQAGGVAGSRVEVIQGDQHSEVTFR